MHLQCTVVCKINLQVHCTFAIVHCTFAGSLHADCLHPVCLVLCGEQSRTVFAWCLCMGSCCKCTLHQPNFAYVTSFCGWNDECCAFWQWVVLEILTIFDISDWWRKRHLQWLHAMCYLSSDFSRKYIGTCTDMITPHTWLLGLGQSSLTSASGCIAIHKL